MNELIEKMYEALGGSISQDQLLALWGKCVEARDKGFAAAVQQNGPWGRRSFELKNAKFFHLLDLLKVKLEEAT